MGNFKCSVARVFETENQNRWSWEVFMTKTLKKKCWEQKNLETKKIRHTLLYTNDFSYTYII